MRNLPVLLFSISLLSVILATKVEPEAEAGTTDYYLLLTLNGSERTVSRVEVDKYGRYIYKGLYSKIREMTPEALYIQLSAVKSVNGVEEEVTVNSVPKLYSGSMKNFHAFSHLTAVIELEEGEVKRITWDDGCHTCYPDKCEQNSVYMKDGELTIIQPGEAIYGPYAGENCYTSASDCQKDESGACDLHIYVVWTGTDKDGRVLQSANLRLSRFQSGSIKSAINVL